VRCNHFPVMSPTETFDDGWDKERLGFTLYITPTVSYKTIGRSRYGGKGESVFHLMSANMGCRGDPLPEALSMQLVRYMPSLVAMQYNPMIIKFSQRLKERGKNGKVIVCAVMRKLVHLIVGILKSGRPFDPTVALRNSLTRRTVSTILDYGEK
jgi:hypothetical protein